jgi:hypothetical protein
VDERHVDDETAVRRLIGTWLSRPVPPREGAGPATRTDEAGTGAAEDVIALARRLATSARWSGHPRRPSPALRLIAEVMVLEELVSTRGWTPAERRDALDWIALVIDRLGEDGVESLIAGLAARG